MSRAETFERLVTEFFAPIAPQLQLESVSEVLINGPSKIFIERAGKLERLDACFEDEHMLYAGIRSIAQYVGRFVDASRPILEARLPDGSRVEAILPPVAPEGPFVAIRRFRRVSLTVDSLVESGSLSRDAAESLRTLIRGKQNLIVAGGTGSGKTSILNFLSSFLGDEERVVVIEDARELQLQSEHVVQLEARPPDAKGRGAITIRDLLKATLRMRPDRIVIGEVRGGEALDLIQAMTTGHSGCMSTVHATYPADTMNRLETLALMSEVGLPLFALRAQVASAIDVIVQIARFRDGSRRITHIAEVVGYHPEQGYRIVNLFDRAQDALDKVLEEVPALRPTGVLPRSINALHEQGLRFPEAVYLAATRSTDPDA